MESDRRAGLLYLHHSSSPFMNVLGRDTRERERNEENLTKERHEEESVERKGGNIAYRKEIVQLSPVAIHKFFSVLQFGTFKDKLKGLTTVLQHHSNNYLSDFGNNNYPAVTEDRGIIHVVNRAC